MRPDRKTEHSCGAVVFRSGTRQTQVLLVLSQIGQHWSFPKGHVESGETCRQTAVREVFEETGIRIRLLGEGVLQKRYYTLPGGIRKRVEYFLAEGDGAPRAQAGETSQALWADTERAFCLLSFRADRQLLRRILSRCHDKAQEEQDERLEDGRAFP